MNPTELNITKIELTPNSGWTLNILSRRVATITDPWETEKPATSGSIPKNKPKSLEIGLSEKTNVVVQLSVTQND